VTMCMQDISSNRGAVSDEGAEAVAHGCQQLRTLDLSGSAITSKVVCKKLQVAHDPTACFSCTVILAKNYAIIAAAFQEAYLLQILAGSAQHNPALNLIDDNWSWKLPRA